MHLRDRETGVAQAGGDRSERGVPIRTTEDQEYGGSDHRADREREEQVDRELGGDEEFDDHQHRDRHDPGSSPLSADEGTNDDEHGRQL